MRSAGVRRRAHPRALLFTLISTAFVLSACGDDNGPGVPSAGGSGGNAPTTPFPPANGGNQQPPNGGSQVPPDGSPGSPNPVEPMDPSDPIDPSPDGSDDEGSDSAVSIAGDPPTAARTETTYDFRPDVNGANPGDLSFSIENMPEWATFDSATGRLTGEPDIEHLGTYEGIVITVSDGEESASLPSFGIDVVPTASGSVTLSWEAPTERDDGSPLLDLAGYRIYWGTVDGEFPNSVTIDNPGLTTYVLEELTPAHYYVVATAIDADGVESSFSNVVETALQ